MIDGELLVRRGELTRFDAVRVAARAREVARELLGRAEI
jgi:hypothetical protein